MKHWNETAVTEAGAEMLNEVMAGRLLTVTAAYGGTGLVDADKLAAQTTLKNRKQTLSIIGDKVTGEGRTLTIQITNAAAEYELNQIGIYAKLDAGRDPEAEEKLLCILQDRQEKGAIIVPSINDPTFVLEVYCVLKISSDGRVEVTIDQTGIVNIAYLEERLQLKSNHNLLVNWYLAKPINQRGLDLYSGRTYTVDRWKSTNTRGIISLTDEGVLFGTNGVGNAFFRQIVQNTFPAGTTLTVSALVKGTASGYVGFIYVDKDDVTTEHVPDVNNTIFPASEDWTVVSFTATVFPEYSDYWPEVTIRNDHNGSIYIKAVKFEVGSVQTLAHKEGDEWVLNDPPPNKAVELAKCQRYFCRMSIPGTFEIIAASGITGTTVSSARAVLTLPVPMRISPTVSVSDDVYVSGSASPELADCKKIKSVQWTALTGTNVRLALNLEEAFSKSQFVFALRTKDIDNQYIEFDANL